MVYWLLVLASCLDSLISTNIAFTHKNIKAPHRFTEMGFHAVELLARLYHVMILWTLGRKLHTITYLLVRLDDSFLRLISLVRVRVTFFNIKYWQHWSFVAYMRCYVWNLFDWWHAYVSTLFKNCFIRDNQWNSLDIRSWFLRSEFFPW